MPVYVIDTLKPKNGLDFPVVEAVDVAVEGYSSLADAVSHFATDAAISALTDVLDGKADKTTTDGLQAQIDQIVISASAESVVAPEVAAARVGEDGTSYQTLKARLDAEQAAQNSTIELNTVQLSEIIEGAPKKETEINLTDSLTFVEDNYISTDGSIISYTGISYAVVKAVSIGDKFKFSGQKLGSAYCILIVTSSEPVNNRYNVLDIVTEGYNEAGYIGNAEYICPANGYLIYQTRSNKNLRQVETEYTFADAENLTVLEGTVSTIAESLPQVTIEEDLSSSLNFIQDEFVSSVGMITSYSNLKYAVVKAVNAGDRFKISGRKVGSEYTVLIVSSAEPINNKYTVLDALTEGYDDLGYIRNAEYTCPVSGYLIYQTQADMVNLKQLELEYTVASSEDVEQLDSNLGNLSDYVDDIFDALPKNEVLVDVTNDIEWHSGYYISVPSGIVTSYAGLAYGIIGTMKKGEKVYVSNSRGVGSSRALTLISSEGIVDGRCTVLDYVPDDARYYTGYYEAPESGILCITWNGTDLSNYPVYRVVYKISAEGGSALKDVKWVTIGDSLNDFNITGITKNWIKYMIEGTECDNTNLAASGTGFYRGVATTEGETSNNYIAKIAAIPEDTELITIAGSFNDISSSPWETLDVGTATDTGNTTIAGYMNAFFDELLENFPEASIGVYMTAPWIGYHYGIQRSDDYVSVLREICLRRGIPFDDSAYYGNGLKPWIEANRIRYYTRTTGTVDGVHPNNEGHKFIYRMLRPFVEKLSPKGNS